MSERIDIEITGEADLDRYLQKLNLILTKQQLLTGDTRGDVSSKTRRTKGEIDSIAKAVKLIRAEGGVNLDELPTINRDLRLLVGQLPYMNRVIYDYYQVRRTVRGIERLRAAQRLDIEGKAKLATEARVSGYIALAATVVFLVNEVTRLRKRLEAADQERENLIRSVTGMTHSEYRNWSKTQFSSYRRSVPF